MAPTVVAVDVVLGTWPPYSLETLLRHELTTRPLCRFVVVADGGGGVRSTRYR